MMMFGKYPAIVKGYDPDTRLALIKLEPLDDGADTLLEAELCYPLGDKSNTAIEILENDPVWVEFEAGDPRYPIIVGNRNKRTGNDDVTRRYHHHGNFEIKADQHILIEALQTITLKVGGSSLKLDADMVQVITPLTTFETDLATFSNLVNVLGLLSANGGLAAFGVGGGAGATIQGGVDVTGGDVKADDISLKGHGHDYTDNGSTLTTQQAKSI